MITNMAKFKTVLPDVAASAVNIAYKEGRFSIWMRVLKNGTLTLLPRKINYSGTFFITCANKTYTYSLPADASHEETVERFIERLSDRCNRLTFNELPPLLQARIA